MSHHANFQVIATIKTAWSNIKGSKRVFWAVLGLVILVRMPQGIISHFQTLYQNEAYFQIVFLIGTLIIAILSLILDYGLYYMGAQRALGLPVRFNMLRHVFTVNMLLKMIGNVLLKFLILLIPMFIMFFLIITQKKFSNEIIWVICLILSWILIIFLIIRMYLSGVILVVEKVNPWRAIKRSFHATRGHVCRLFCLFILNMLILIISVIPLGIGLIWTLPYFFINQGVVYQILAGKERKT